MTKDFYFKFYFKDWLVSTQGMDAEVRGWYITLLCHQADKHRLPSDLESLADLAGVKISQFERFKECFKRTLKQKFIETEEGTLYNEKMDEVINNRKKDHSKQSKRATIGVFIKKMRKEHNFEESVWGDFSADLMTVDLSGLSTKEKYNALTVRFKHMLKAVINNSNYNYNYISIEKGGVGEKTAYEVLKERSPIWLEQFEMKNKRQIQDWDAFLVNFEYAVEKDEIPLDQITLLQKRMNKQYANWDKSAKKNTTNKPKTLINER